MSTEPNKISNGRIPFAVVAVLINSLLDVSSFQYPSHAFVQKKYDQNDNIISCRRKYPNFTLEKIPLYASSSFDENNVKRPYDAESADAEKAKMKSIQEKAKQQNSQFFNNKNDSEWQFFDTARMHVSGGFGGNGCVAFRREKGDARGGPYGGSGGNGGNVYLICDESINTLAPIRNSVHVRAHKGNNGIGKGKHGRDGNDIYARVPPGTIVRDLKTQKVAGELRNHDDVLLVARGGRGGRGNLAFKTPRNTAPKLAERGEPPAKRWLSLELRLVADVGFLGKPNAGKSTLLAAASNARPKIANYPFTTIVPNLGVCDLGFENGVGLVLCDVPGLIEGAAGGAGLGPSFLRHVQRCKVLLHVLDGSSSDVIEDYKVIQNELKEYDEFLYEKPQVIVLNKCDIPEVQEKAEDIKAKLKEISGHTRILTISAATTENVKELMFRLKKFVDVQEVVDLPPLPEIDLSKADIEDDYDDFEIISDPAYPGQWRVEGGHIEQVAKMTHWEYPEAVERFGRQLKAYGIADELIQRGAVDGDLVMVDQYDFEFKPGFVNPYIPQELLEKDFLDGLMDEDPSDNKPRGMLLDNNLDDDDDDWDPDAEELLGFNEDGDWDSFENGEFDDFIMDDDEVFTY